MHIECDTVMIIDIKGQRRPYVGDLYVHYVAISVVRRQSQSLDSMLDTTLLTASTVMLSRPSAHPSVCGVGISWS